MTDRFYLLKFQHHCRKVMRAAHSIHVLAQAKIKKQFLNVIVNIHTCEIQYM